jgi:methylated-DNA-[protein]-cysteine S-methyltransferase
MEWTRLPSPLGELTLTADGTAVTGLWLPRHRRVPALSGPEARAGALPAPLAAAREWLELYFSGRDPGPTPSLRTAGTPFEEAVWAALRAIPYGGVTTYGRLSAALREAGLRACPQAVGGAVGRNPISLLIPCHRVVGSGGSLTGYAGGLEAKRYLLELEGADVSRLTASIQSAAR